MPGTPSEAQSRHTLMTETPIPRLVTRMAMPTMASMLVTSIYNMADTYFVGMLGQSASGAVGVVFTLMLFIQAIGFTLGMGSGANIAQLLGAKDEETASRIASTGFFTSLLLGLVLAVGGLVFLDPLVYLLGATPTIAPHARAYGSYILIGAPYMAASFVVNNILRSQGNAFWSMIGLTTGGVLNILLDPLFIFVFDMGTAGAALATIVSQLVSFLILLVMVMRHSAARISLRKVHFSYLKRILPVGLPSFYRQGLTSLATILLNRAAGVYGDAAIAAMSIVSRIMGFFFSALIGFYQGFQPVCGFNYGAGLTARVRQAILFCLRVSTIGLCIIAALAIAFAEPLVGLFRQGDTGGHRHRRAGAAAAGRRPADHGLGRDYEHGAPGAGHERQSVAAGHRPAGHVFHSADSAAAAAFWADRRTAGAAVADLCSFLLAFPFGLSLLRGLKDGSIRRAS